MQTMIRVACVGFGEAATAFVKGWKERSSQKISAFDIKTDSAETRAAKLEDYQMAGVCGETQLEKALEGVEVIFSLVTADQAAIAAQATAKHITQGQYYFDCNSCSPETKKVNAQLIESAGGRYVDVAVMAPVYPALHQTPLLICGSQVNSALAVFAELDMKATLIEGGVGSASAIKMIRSIMIKGMEALTAECSLAARKAGVEKNIFASLDDSFPGFNWRDRSAYMLERMMVHGLRRAAEMREVALTVEQLGLSNDMTHATEQWQQRIGELALQPESEKFELLADSILQHL